jgi:ATP-dependent Clp protease ATP-binding subunit ClpA
MTTFGSYVSAIMRRGRDEARKDGSAVVEAQHLLLAMAAGPDAAPRRVLADAGLEYMAIRRALDREFERSLGVAGVSPAAFDLAEPSAAAESPGHLGASARLAVERTFAQAARQKDLQPVHLLIGILAARMGTVPRALALAGIDQASLAQEAQRVLADPDT